MGMLFAAECDVCGIRQIKKNAHEIEGSTYMENSVQKFICTPCKSLMKATFEIKKGGLRNPLSKVAGLVEERDEARRERDEAISALRGENPFAAVTIGNPKAALEPPKEGAVAALLGYAHSEFRILRVVELGGSPAQFIVVVEARSGDRKTYNIRGGAPLLASAIAFKEAVSEASGGELGRMALLQSTLDHMLSAAPRRGPESKKKRDGGNDGK